MKADNRTRSDLLARLEPYWKMEAGNAVILPLVALLLSKGKVSWVGLLPMAAMVVLLVIGALYWRGKVRLLKQEADEWPGLMRLLARSQWPALILTLLGCAAMLASWILPGLALGMADRWVATGCAVLALLEYINYYHRQLQHFDNKADFRRMLAGQGFRQSSMARDLAAWRKGEAR
ncbi:MULTISPECIES: hypothetical protein [unclassified Novosphingobium]|uniref:hypothetical protein n=1 Tax=unclassified Novosphingobium TaxID=2644732 RepID=UPI000EC133BA|nr:MULTISPECIES: hypothetical protein [unclassified Novosphingobium]HCF24490.1 hypothetical protein [Novosphingobium sp.]HQV03793.1 hypothetical protein [Novosphingobium sp.]